MQTDEVRGRWGDLKCRGQDGPLNQQGLTSAARLGDVTARTFGHLHGGENLKWGRSTGRQGYHSFVRGRSNSNYRHKDTFAGAFMFIVSF